MGDLNSIILTKAKSPAATVNADSASDPGAPAPAADGIMTNAKTDFAAILKSSLANNAAEKSGNALPHVPPETSESDPASEPDSSVDMDLSKHLLESRSLQSGLQVIVGGKAPSDAGVDAFAKSQGIDPRALALLTERNRQLPIQSTVVADGGEEAEPDLTVAPKVADAGSAFMIAPKVTITEPKPIVTSKVTDADSTPIEMPKVTDADPTPIETPKVTDADHTPIKRPKVTDADPEPIAAWLSDSAIAQLISGAPAAPLPGRQTIEAYLQKPTRFSTPSQQPSSDQKPGSALPETFNLEQLAAAIKSKPINTQQQDLPVNQIDEKLTFKAPASKTLTENFSPLNNTQQQQPAIKLEAINLVPKAAVETVKTKSAENKIAALPTVATAPVSTVVASGPTPVIINESGFISAAPTFDTRSEQATTDTLPEQLEQQSLRKQEEQADMSRRLAEALGQRLSAQISRGAWRVEMDLHPKSLGRIEIQLEMRNGELEANFNAANAATRELLQDSMPRLRDALEEHGMESAYIGLGLGNQTQSDGNPTAQNSASESADLPEGEEAGTGEHTERLDDNGLDVMV